MKLQNKRNYLNEKGITLIALIVTIVVLLILAGVGINAVLGENGLINKAQDAQNKMNNAIEKDKEAINNLSQELENIVNPSVPVTGVKILYNGVESTSTNVNGGTVVSLTVKVEPANATNKKVTWSANSGMDNLNVNSSTGVATFLAPQMTGGDYTYVITVTTEDGNKTASFTINSHNEACCFVAGTQVLCDLEGNTKNIENCKAGDIVVSYNVETGKNYLAKVQRLIVNPKATSMAKIYLEDGTMLDMTDYHPLYTKEGFKSLTNHNGLPTLTEQDYVRTTEGFTKIAKIERYTTEPMVTYNLDIIDFDEEIDNDENDNFYVNGIAAHNANCPT